MNSKTKARGQEDPFLDRVPSRKKEKEGGERGQTLHSVDLAFPNPVIQSRISKSGKLKIPHPHRDRAVARTV